MTLYEAFEYQLMVCDERQIMDVFEGSPFRFIIHASALDEECKQLICEEAHKRGYKLAWTPGESLIGLEAKRYALSTGYLPKWFRQKAWRLK